MRRKRILKKLKKQKNLFWVPISVGCASQVQHFFFWAMNQFEWPITKKKLKI
jgi:hypothetical protein